MTGPLKQEEGQPVKYSPGGEIIRFSVKDYGKGIDKKDFKTIFEPFSQASKETQNLYGSTGVGLSVHRIEGSVGLDSGPNYAIPETKPWHFKSLLGFFPAALLEAIAENIVTQDLDHVPRNDEFYSPELETVLENTDSSLHSELQADKSEEMEQHTSSNRGLFAPLLSETMGAGSVPSKEAIKGCNDSAQPENPGQDKCDELKDEKSEPSTQVTSAQGGSFSSLAVEKEEGSGAPGKAGAAPGGLFAALLNQGDSLVDKKSTVQGDGDELRR